MIEIHKKISVFTLFLITVISSFLLFNDTSAAPDQELTYHGKLTDTSNVAVPDGDYDFTIVMYDAETGGNCLWSARGDCTTPTSKTLTVTNGTFSTTLGESGDNALSSLDFSSNYYLGITIGTNSEMTPRRKITPTGFALNSHRLNGLEAKESGADAHILATSTFGDAEISGDFTVNSNDLFVDTTSGRVGIGMNNPGSKLQVEGDIIAGNTQTSGESRLRLVGDTGNGISYLQAGNSSVDTSARLHLARFFTADTELEEFRVYAAESYISGNLGIGTLTPNDMLQVGTAWRSVLTGSGYFDSVGEAPYMAFNAFETATAGVWDTVDSAYDGAVIVANTSNSDTISKMRFGFIDQADAFESTAMTILKNGNVGIGASAPDYKLEITGDLRVSDTQRLGNSIGEPGRLRFYDSDGYLMSFWNDSTDYDNWGMHWDTAHDDIEWMGNGTVQASIGLNDGDGYFAGKVGIGTTLPDAALHISGSTAASSALRISSTATGGKTWAMFSGTNAINAVPDGSLGFYDDSESEIRMIISGNGNVGIGTKTPDYKLQVDGDIVPEVDDTYTLGTSSLRWQDVYIGPNSLHIGEDGNDVTLSYNAGVLEFSEPTTIVGSMQLTNDTDTCDTSKEGTMRYNDTTKVMEFCNGTDWGSLASGSSGTSGGGGWVSDGTQVFSGTAPTTFTDIDLSSIVGTQKTLVMLSVDTSTSAQYYFNNGNLRNIYAGSPETITLETDENGVITWRAATAYTATVTLKGYIGAGGAALPTTCTDGQILAYNDTSSEWECADNTGGSGGGWVHSGQQVFSGTSPTSWTDLDLSSIVGQVNALVMLKVASTETGDTTYEFRANGDDTEYVWGYGASSTVLRNSGDYVVLETDSNGVIEWNSTGLFATTIDLLGYVGTGSSSSGSGQNWSLMHVQDQKVQGTNGGTSIVGTQTRDLNTVITNEITGASLASDQITLPVGEYYIEFYSATYGDGQYSKSAIVDTSDSSVLVQGSGGANGNYSGQFGFQGFGKVTLTEETIVEVETTTSVASSVGLGVATNQGLEIYTDVRIWKIEESLGGTATLPACLDGQTLSYNETLSEWECADVSGTGGGWVHSGQQIFSGDPAGSWTDLDLSSIVGSQETLVQLKVKSTDNANNYRYQFRTNGDVEDIGDGTIGSAGTTEGYITDGEIIYVTVETDDAGIVEWQSSSSSAEVYVAGYIGASSSISGSGQNWSLMHVQDQKTDGTNGGTSVTGSNQRDLNTVVINEIAGASLSSNTVTLPAGEYYAEAYSLAYAYSSQRHKIDLEDASGTLLVSGVNADTGGYNARSVLSGKFTLTAETDVVIDDYISTGRATDGLGSAVSGDGRPEIYTDVRFWKIESAAASSSLWAELGDNVYFDTGNIGIGTSAPTSIFEVQGNDTVARFSNENASGADTGINIIGARNGLIAGDTAYIDFSDYDSDEGVGTEFQMARISGGMNDMSGQTGMLKFSTNGGSGLVERMYIDKNGVMNINSFNGGLGITLNDGGGSVDVGSDILFSAQGLLASESNMFFNIDTDADETGAIFAFGKNSDTSAAARVMTITEGGLVGIGADVSAPEQEMHIASYSPTIRLSDVNAANDTEVATFIEWYRGANTNRTGWLGFGSPLDANMSMTNHVGDILLSPTGSVGISNTSPAYKLEISGGDVNTTSGGYRDAGGCVAGTCASDINLKEDIEPITDSLEKILDLKPSTFKFIDSKYGSTELNYGFIAQELEEIYPEWVTIDEGDGYKRVKYGLNIQMATINAIQEQNSLITTNDFTIKEAAKSVNELQISTNDQFAKVSTLFASTRDDAGENDTLRSDILLLQTESNEQADILDYIQGRVAVAEAGISLLNALTDNDPTRLVDLLAIDVDNLLFVNQEGTLEGDLTIEGIVTAESLVVDTVSARVVTAEGVEIRESDSANKTVGTGVIVSGETEVYIETGAVTENSRIFVTPRGRIEKILAIDGTDEGQGFTVGIMDTSDEDIAFDWFIVTEVNNEEEVGEMIEEIGMSDLEREDVNE